MTCCWAWHTWLVVMLLKQQNRWFRGNYWTYIPCLHQKQQPAWFVLFSDPNLLQVHKNTTTRIPRSRSVRPGNVHVSIRLKETVLMLRQRSCSEEGSS